MAQEISVSAFQALMAACSDYIAAEDWYNATLKLTQAEIVNSALELDIASQGDSIRRRETLKGVREMIEWGKAQSGGRTKNRLVNTRVGFGR